MNSLYKTLIADRKKIGRSILVNGTSFDITNGGWLTVTIGHDGGYTPANVYSLREAWVNLSFFTLSPAVDKIPPFLYITADGATEFSIGSTGASSNIIGVLVMK